MTEKERMWE